jgi:hypothetical protein
MFKPYQIVIWWYTPVGKNPALGQRGIPLSLAPFFKVVVMTIPKRHSPGGLFGDSFGTASVVNITDVKRPRSFGCRQSMPRIFPL